MIVVKYSVIHVISLVATLCFVPAGAGAQEGVRLYFDVRAPTAKIGVSTRSNLGVELALSDADSSVRLAPSPFVILAWADSAESMLMRPLSASTGQSVGVRTPELAARTGHLALRRTDSLGTSTYFLFAAGPYNEPFVGSSVTRPTVDSLLAAMRRAANDYVTAQGEPCRPRIDSAIAAKGQPTERRRGGNADGSLYEKLTFPGRLSDARLYYFTWGATRAGCVVESF